MQIDPMKAKRLLKLNEEAGEIVQIVSKTVLFGEISHYKDMVIDNKAKLESEIGDLLANLDYLIAAGDLSLEAIQNRKAVKIAQLAADPGLQDSHGVESGIELSF